MSDRDVKSDHILDAALPVFVRYGFRKASMSDIARAAGISRASLYLSFNSKEELFRAGSMSRRRLPGLGMYSAVSKRPWRCFSAN
jgi:DNA-binding transcriptional regulator YbjK